MTFEELCWMREGVAKEKGIRLFKEYSEPEAAAFLGISLDMLKDIRYAGKSPAIRLGPRKYRYLGVHIVDLFIKGDQWQSLQDVSSKSENGGLARKPEATHGAEHGTTPKPDKLDVHHLAQIALKKPSKS